MLYSTKLCIPSSDPLTKKKDLFCVLMPQAGDFCFVLLSTPVNITENRMHECYISMTFQPIVIK